MEGSTVARCSVHCLGALIMPKRTHLSVTEKSCQCNYLQRAADNPENPIRFDQRTSEYQFVFGDGRLRIFHCPFCGGAAPESKRSLLFAQIPYSEEDRLSQVLEPIKTIDDALELLGKPDVDSYLAVRTPEAENKAPTIERLRDIRYYGLSDVADVSIAERPDGLISWHLQGKYVGDQSPDR